MQTLIVEYAAYNCGFRSLEGKASIVNPVNKLYSLACKVEETFFVPARKKHE